MHSTNLPEHQDILRVVAYSDASFDEAVKNGLQELACPASGHEHHEDLEFKTFEVVQLQGVVSHNRAAKSCGVKLFQVVMDVTGSHRHEV